MKVLHFTPSFYPTIGGIESVVKTLSLQMSYNSCEVIIVCLSKVPISKSNFSYLTPGHSIPIYYFSHADLFRFKRVRLLISLLRSCDILHLHDPKFALLLIVSYFFAPQKNFFMTTHGGFYHNRRYSLLKKLYLRMWVSFALKKFVKVFAISKDDFNRLSRLSPRKILYTPNPVTENPFGVDPFLHPHSLRNWLYWGRASKNKNLLNLLKLVKLMHKRKIYISLNICSKDSLNYLKSYAKDNSIDNVNLIENACDETIATLIANSSVFVLPSTYEGFGLTLVEAASSGLIPFYNDISPINELLNKDIGLALDFNNLPLAVDSFLTYEARFLSSNYDITVSEMLDSCKTYSPAAITNTILREYNLSLS